MASVTEESVFKAKKQKKGEREIRAKPRGDGNCGCR